MENKFSEIFRQEKSSVQWSKIFLFHLVCVESENLEKTNESGGISKEQYVFQDDWIIDQSDILTMKSQTTCLLKRLQLMKRLKGMQAKATSDELCIVKI